MTAEDLTRDRPPFAMVPEALLYDERVTGFDVRLYGALDRHAGAGAVAWPGYARLRGLLAYIEPTTGQRREPSDEAIGAAVGRLEAAGWLDVTRSNGKSNRYRLRDRRRPQAGDGPVEEPSTTRASAAGPEGSTGRASAVRPPAPARREVEKGTREDPPNPPRAGGTELAHEGQHPNCRACGTTRRGPRTDPEAELADARRREHEANTERLRALLHDPDVESDPEARRRKVEEMRAARQPERPPEELAS